MGEVPFGRGIWIGGSEEVTIEGNWIGHTSNGGIEVFEDTYIPAYPVPPAHNIVIRNNLVYGSLGPMASGSGTQIALGAISVVSTNNTNRFATSQPNSNISIQNNFVFDSGRCGIWVGELNGGTIRDNLIVGFDKYPELPLFGISPQESTQLLPDFTQPIVVHYSQGVTVQDNLELNN
ncbi:MAG: right-handed parallel beta-helix repeat-containing protein [Verrucomicrobia bacterium]|nr:right-handed parallel beta-helix repeat-containing protein [Verrucomicrobiota bacterium]